MYDFANTKTLQTSIDVTSGGPTKQSTIEYDRVL